MTQTIKQSLFQSEANAMQNAIEQYLLNQVNTLITAKIVTVNSDGTYDVQPTLKYLNLKSNPVIPPVLPNIPATVKRYGNAAIKGDYVVGDTVIIGVIQRDISIIKKAWNAITNPASYRKFNLADGIILDAVSNSEPTTFIELKDGEINIVTTTVNINASTVNINGELIINNLPYVDHEHEAGSYMDGNSKPVTGTSGGLS